MSGANMKATGTRLEMRLGAAVVGGPETVAAKIAVLLREIEVDVSGFSLANCKRSAAA